MARSASSQPLSLAGLGYLGVVYLVWGSTYLAIRVAVREGSGFPPFAMGATRLPISGLFLLALAALRGRSLRLPREEWAVVLGSGALLWTAGNGLVAWAEQRADSGYAALVIGSVPLWVAMFEAALDRRAPSLSLLGALLVGFAGIGLLTLPVLQAGARADVLSVLALLGAAVAWSAGSLWQQRRPVSSSPMVSAGYQQLVGGLGLAPLSLAAGEPLPRPTEEAWAAWAYLVLFGSLAFFAYVQTLRLLPISVSMTYAYVNPVIAVMLGWLILDEPVTGWTLAGAALVLLGVAGVFRERYAHRAVRRRVPASSAPGD